MIWEDEVPTVKLANPLADPPPRRRTPMTREYETRLTEATCLAAAKRCARILVRQGRTGGG